MGAVARSIRNLATSYNVEHILPVEEPDAFQGKVTNLDRDRVCHRPAAAINDSTIFTTDHIGAMLAVF
jgi:hypothetical protein